MHHFIRFILCLFFFIQTAQAGLPGGISALYVFGDSLSDIGNFHAPAGSNCLQDNGTSAPVTNPVGGLYPGKLWVNFLAAKYGLVPTPGSLAHSQGTDWAKSGAETYDVVGQIQNYVNTNKVDKNALYAIWAGSNDLIFRLRPNPPKSTPTPEQVILHGMGNIYGGIALLYKNGARKFLVIGVPDISLTPAAIFLSQQNPSLLPNLRKLCFYWNDTLFNPQDAPTPRPSLANLRQLPGIQIYVWNPTSFLVQVVNNPVAFDFQKSVNGQPNNHMFWCVLNQFLDPDKLLFFNGIHPTSHSHNIIANAMMNQARLF